MALAAMVAHRSLGSVALYCGNLLAMPTTTTNTNRYGSAVKSGKGLT
jgi:hypothetical protein